MLPAACAEGRGSAIAGECLPCRTPRQHDDIRALGRQAPQQRLIGMRDGVDCSLQLRFPEGFDALVVDVQNPEVVLCELVSAARTFWEWHCIDVVPHAIGAEPVLLGAGPTVPGGGGIVEANSALPGNGAER